jgi:hypothetical protein
MTLRKETSAALEVTINGEPHTIRFTLNALIALKQRGYNILEGGDAFARLFTTADPETMRLLLWAGLRHENPKRTEEEVGEMCDLTTFAELHRSAVEAFQRQASPEDGADANPPAAAAGSPGSSSGPSPATTSD